jgi:hypothetical protein
MRLAIIKLMSKYLPKYHSFGDYDTSNAPTSSFLQALITACIVLFVP